jgi:hypothetical protein
MPERDIVFTFFATPSKDAETMQPTSLFANSPLVIPVGSSGTKGGHPFWTLKTEGGRALPPLLRQAKAKLGGATPGRVCAVGFSAGRTGAQQLIAHPEDRRALDVMIDLDGLHFMKTPNGQPADAQVSPWVEYGKLCANGSHLLALLHTAIVPANANQIFSTTESNKILFDRLTQSVGEASGQPWDQANLQKGPPPPAITIDEPKWGKDGKVVGYNKVVYEVVPPMAVRQVGNAFSVGMPGGGPAAHIFAANWGQRALWQTFLAPRWNGFGGGSGNAFSFFGTLPNGVSTTYLMPSDYADEGDVPSEGSLSPLGKVLAFIGVAAAAYAGYRVWKE